MKQFVLKHYRKLVMLIFLGIYGVTTVNSTCINSTNRNDGRCRNVTVNDATARICTDREWYEISSNCNKKDSIEDPDDPTISE